MLSKRQNLSVLLKQGDFSLSLSSLNNLAMHESNIREEQKALNLPYHFEMPAKSTTRTQSIRPPNCKEM